MSEGDSFLHKATYDLTLLLRASPLRTSKPVAHAEEMVRRFCTKELRGVAGGIGEVEEYVANAALDLVIMAVWSLAAGQLDLENLPVSTTFCYFLFCRYIKRECEKLIERGRHIRLLETFGLIKRLLKHCKKNLHRYRKQIQE